LSCNHLGSGAEYKEWWGCVQLKRIMMKGEGVCVGVCYGEGGGLNQEATTLLCTPSVARPHLTQVTKWGPRLALPARGHGSCDCAVPKSHVAVTSQLCSCRPTHACPLLSVHPGR
jgi:hypothetical protein